MLDMLLSCGFELHSKRPSHQTLIHTELSDRFYLVSKGVDHLSIFYLLNDPEVLLFQSLTTKPVKKDRLDRIFNAHIETPSEEESLLLYGFIERLVTFFTSNVGILKSLEKYRSKKTENLIFDSIIDPLCSFDESLLISQDRTPLYMMAFKFNTRHKSKNLKESELILYCIYMDNQWRICIDAFDDHFSFTMGPDFYSAESIILEVARSLIEPAADDVWHSCQSLEDMARLISLDHMLDFS